MSDDESARDRPDAEPPFDPYRFGAPDHPVPPEFAPPGYVPPPVSLDKPPDPTQPPPNPYGQQYPGSGTPPNPYARTRYGQSPYGQPPGYPPNPYQPNPYGPYSPNQPGAAQPGRGKAVTALVAGIGSIVLCWLTFFDVIPVVLGIVFGILAIREASRARVSRSMAVWGLVLSLVGAVLATVITVVVFSKASDCLSGDQTSSQIRTCVQDKFN